MTSSYENMTAAELRDERLYWMHQTCMYAREYRLAVQSGELGWELGMGVALDQALAQVKRLEALLRLGVAA